MSSTPDSAKKNEEDFFKVATVSTCIGFAIVGGALASLREETDGLHFKISWASLLTAGICGVAGWLLWKIFRKLAAKDKGSR